MSEFENFKEEFPSKEKMYSFFTGKKNCYKEHATEICNKFEKRGRKIITT